MSALLRKLPTGPSRDRTWEFQKLYEAAKRARLPFDKEAWLNTAFYLGEQYIEWAGDAQTVRRIARPEGNVNTPRPVSNKIMHFVQQELASVLQSRPTIDVLPASEDPQDISNSNVALAYLNWLTDPQVADFNNELMRASLWALCATEGYLKWVWDPRILNADGTRGRGDICACGPMDVYPDPYAKDFKDCRYVIHSQFMDTERVYDIYGVEMQPTDVDKADPVKVALMREMGMAPVLEGVNVNELWMKPNRRYPHGLYVVWSHQQMLVEAGPYPYKHNQLPFTQIGSIPRPGTLHYTSAVSFLRTPQMELNKFHAQMIQVREAFANPKWFIPSELELEEDPSDAPNQILRGNTQNGTLRPELIQPMTMPPNDAGAWIANEMMDIVGIHDVSNAQVPGRVEAAKAIELLKESDDSRLAEMLRTIETSITVGFYQQLQLAKQFQQGERILTSYSREGVAEVRKFMATELDPAMRVKTMMGTGLAKSRASRQDQLMDMWNAQIIHDPELMAELMDIPVSSVSPDNAFDIRLARNENLTMAAGTPIKPNSWDNHDIHRREHNNYRKTTEYMNLSTTTKNMLEFHVQMHDSLQVQSLGQQLQIQQLSAAVANGVGFQLPPPGQQGPGTPGGPPGSAPAGNPAALLGKAPPPTPPHAPPPPPTPQAPPEAAGAHSPLNLDSVRQSPQGAAHYLDTYASGLSSNKNS